MRSLIVALVASGAALLCVANGGAATSAPKLRFMEVVYLDAEGKGMRKPEGVACGQGALWVADSGNGRLLRYRIDADGLQFEKEVVLPGAYPIRVALNSKGEAMVLDAKSKKLMRFDASGQGKGEVKFSRVPQGDTVIPRSLVFDRNDNLYVLDVFAARIIVMQPGGMFREEFALPQDAVFVSDLAVGPGGDIYLLDSVNGIVFHRSSGSEAFAPLTEGLDEDMNFPVSLALGREGQLFVVDKYGGGLVLVGPDGSYMGRRLGMGWTDGRLRYPSQICIDGTHNLFLADRENNRVQRFVLVDPDG